MTTKTLALSMLFAAAGCAHRPAAKAPDTAAAAPGAGGTKASADAIAASCKSDGDCTGGRQCVNGTCAAAKDELDACTEVHVHFAYDSIEIPDDDRGQLERAARCLRSRRVTKVDIEGNADERGTEEYNLALGDRRAQSVARYLEKLGAAPQQVKTLSYGEENPVCTEHDEACWSKNRRAAVKPSDK